MLSLLNARRVNFLVLTLILFTSEHFRESRIFKRYNN